MLSAPLQKEEDAILVSYCRNSNSIFVHDFLLNYLIQKGRYAEALEAYQVLFVSKGIENAARQNLIKNVGMLLPRVQRMALGISVPVYAHNTMDVEEEEKEPSNDLLSQTYLIRQGQTSEKNVLEALKENYLVEEIPSPVKANETVDLDLGGVDYTSPRQSPVLGTPNHGGLGLFQDQEDVEMEPAPQTKVSASSTPAGRKSLAGNHSPASPFIQQPYVSDIGKTYVDHL